ncbi:sensor histidine kinase [Olivibacter domesticus]
MINEEMVSNLAQRKSIFSLKTIFIGIHIVIWGIVLFLPYYISSPPDFNIGPVPGLFFTLTGVVHVFIFYTNAYYLYPKFLNLKWWWFYFITVIALLVLSFQMKHAMLINWFPTVAKNVSLYKFIYPPSIGIFIASFIYRKVVNKINQEKSLKEQRAEKLASELKFLRSQINPHFLFNVLTNLVSLARKKSDKLEASLLMLSDLMRYMLYDSQNRKVFLQQEIEYLNSYIALQKLRFGDAVNIKYTIHRNEEIKKHQIEPMLLIPFVENAFKHGVGWIDAPQINIMLIVKDDVLTFEVSNQYDAELDINKDKDSGIGLTNVKTRLELLYSKHYNLEIKDKDNLFRIILILDLV